MKLMMPMKEHTTLRVVRGARLPWVSSSDRRRDKGAKVLRFLVKNRGVEFHGDVKLDKVLAAVALFDDICSVGIGHWKHFIK